MSNPDVLTQSTVPQETGALRRRLVVHIGLHKTGTTSIQQSLNDAAYHLHLAGVLYPSSARHPLAAAQHGLLAKAFDPDTPFPGVFALAAAIDRQIVVSALKHEIELSGLHTAIVSSEELSRLSADQVAQFGSAFADFDIQPIAFVRNFPDLFEAAYSTLIQYTSYTIQPTVNMMSTDLVTSFAAWASISADATIRVVDVDASPTGDSVVDFLSAIDIDSAAVPQKLRAPRLNRSLAPAHVVLMRELRARRIPESQIASLLAQLSPVEFQERQTCLPPTLRDELAARYASQMRVLRDARYVQGLGSDVAAPQESPATAMNDLSDVLLAIGRGVAAMTTKPGGSEAG